MLLRDYDWAMVALKLTLIYPTVAEYDTSARYDGTDSDWYPPLIEACHACGVDGLSDQEGNRILDELAKIRAGV